MISEIIDNIYVGNWNDAQKNSNSYIIFTVAYDSPFKSPEYYYNIRDGGDTDPGELLRAIMDLYRIRKDKKDQNILVHCISGYSRSIIVVAGYLMLKYDCTSQDAITFIKSKRDIGLNNPNPGLIYLISNFHLKNDRSANFRK